MNSLSGRSRPRAVALVMTLAFGITGCATFSIPTDRCPSYPAALSKSHAPRTDDVTIQYLGSGGYMAARGDDVVLFGPVYTNPGIAEVFLDHEIRTDRRLVDLLLPARAKGAQAIVIGHSHYDHLLDTPYIASEKAKDAIVYGSSTTKNLLDFMLPGRVVDVASYADSNQPIPIGTSGRMRLWAIPSRHSDQVRLKVDFLGLNLPVHSWRGDITEKQTRLPRTASGWAEGRVYAYVLDFLSPNGDVDFRLYYQDSGTDTPIGLPSAAAGPRDQVPYDVSLLCVGGDFRYLTAHPEAAIASTHPRFVILGHWEDFFVTQGEYCRTRRVSAIPPPDPHVRKYGTKEFVARTNRVMKDKGISGQAILPCPTASVFHFPRRGGDDAPIHEALRKRTATYDCAIPPS